MIVHDRGPLTMEQMLELLKPGALNQQQIAGFRIRWAILSSPEQQQETKRVSEALKARHYQLGATEVLVHQARYSAPPTDTGGQGGGGSSSNEEE